MKKEIKKGILLVTLVLSMTSYATNPSKFKTSNDINRTTLLITTVKIGQQLVIKDAYGMILYRETIKQSGNYNKTFDLTTLPNGDYYFELEKDLEIQIIPFNVKFATVEFAKEKETKIYKPFVRLKDNRIYLSRLTLDGKPLNVQIYYSAADDSSQNELIYSENIDGKKVIERIYMLQKEKKGNYKVLMKVEDRQFSQRLTF